MKALKKMCYSSKQSRPAKQTIMVLFSWSPRVALVVLKTFYSSKMTYSKLRIGRSMKVCVALVILLGLLDSSACIPREILKSDRKPKNELEISGEKIQKPDDEGLEQTKVLTALFQDLQISSLLTSFSSIFNSILSTISSLLTSIKSSLEGILGSLGGSASGLISIPKPSLGNITQSVGCNLIDPNLGLYTPGIFFGTPIAIVLLAIGIKIIAVITIVIGSLIAPHVDKLIDSIHNSKDEDEGGYGYSNSQTYGAPTSSYGAPTSSYGTPNQYSNSRYSETVDALTQGFEQAQDKYSQFQQQPQQTYDEYYKQNQYVQWPNTNPNIANANMH